MPDFFIQWRGQNAATDPLYIDIPLMGVNGWGLSFSGGIWGMPGFPPGFMRGAGHT